MRACSFEMVNNVAEFFPSFGFPNGCTRIWLLVFKVSDVSPLTRERDGETQPKALCWRNPVCVAHAGWGLQPGVNRSGKGVHYHKCWDHSPLQKAPEPCNQIRKQISPLNAWRGKKKEKKKKRMKEPYSLSWTQGYFAPVIVLSWPFCPGLLGVWGLCGDTSWSSNFILSYSFGPSILILFIFGAAQHGTWLPNQESNPCPLQWKLGVFPLDHQGNQVHHFYFFSSVQSLSRVRLFETPWIAARQASLSITNSRSSPKLMCIELVMPSSHLILCCFTFYFILIF